MAWVICFFLGLIVGASCVIVALFERIRKAAEDRKRAEDLTARNQSELTAIESDRRELDRDRIRLTEERASLDRRVISYDELRNENGLLKRDLQNIDVTLNKLQLDTELLGEKQRELDGRSNDLAARYLKETVKSVSNSLNSNNFAACKARLLDAVTRVRAIGFPVDAKQEAVLIAELQSEYETVVKAAIEREEQTRIKAKIREEERLRREAEAELERAERERAAIQVALQRALAETTNAHSAEVEALKAQLSDAEARAFRAVSMAQQTKAGNVYVISNIGSFGKGVFKVGMTRRLEPLDRIRELGDASVPFPFDVHMMISCNDAPALENALHKALHKSRLNRVNPRKEFFRTDIGLILEVVEANHGKVEYTADPAALEYNQSLTMSEADAEFIEAAYDAAMDDGARVVAED